MKSSQQLMWNGRKALTDLVRSNQWLLVCAAVAMTPFFIFWMMALPNPLLALALPILVVFGLVALRVPGAIFAAYLYIPFYKGVVDPYLPVDLTLLLAVVCLALTLPLLLDHNQGLPLGVVGFWTGLLAVVGIGTLYAADTDLAVTQLMYFFLLSYLPLMLGIRIVRDRRLLDQFLVATVLLSVIVTIVGLIQIGSLGLYDRLQPMSNTIGTARSTLFLPLILAMIIQTSPRWLSVVAMCMAPFAVFIAVAAGSRGPLVMAILTIVIVQLLTRQKIGKKALFGALALVLSIIVLQAPQVQQILPQQSIWRIQLLIDAMVGRGELDNSSMSRVQLLDIATEMFLARPILGYGTAGFETVAKLIPDMSDLRYPHNLVAQVAAEFGIMGLVVTAIFISTAFFRGSVDLQNPRTQAIFTLALFGFLNAFVSGSFYEDRWVWGMLLVLLALESPAKAPQITTLPPSQALQERKVQSYPGS